VICCTNKCIINERYIPEHQNKLNVYDLQNYEFFANFFQSKKIRKIRILDLCPQVSVGRVLGFHTCRTLTFSYPGVSYPRHP